MVEEEAFASEKEEIKKPKGKKSASQSAEESPVNQEPVGGYEELVDESCRSQKIRRAIEKLMAAKCSSCPQGVCPPQVLTHLEQAQQQLEAALAISAGTR